LKFLRCKPSQVPSGISGKVAIIGAGTAASAQLACSGARVTR